MFGFKRKSAAAGATAPVHQPVLPRFDVDAIRDTLFGDLPLSDWPPDDGAAAAGGAEPWASFVRAREFVEEDKPYDAIAQWQQVVAMPELESRHYAQAWHFLRVYGVEPPPGRAKALLGVVIEYPMEGGLDVLAAYPEHTVRYYNFSGSAVISEHPNDSLDPLIDELLRAGQGVVNAIGPWDKPRPPAPAPGRLRLSFLTPSGLHFGEGPADQFPADPLAKPVFDAGTKLMQALVLARGGGGRLGSTSQANE
jgi:hypothetical protein